MYVSVCRFMHMCVQKRALVSLKLEMQTVVSYLVWIFSAPNLCLLQEQQVLLILTIAPSLQPHTVPLLSFFFSPFFGVCVCMCVFLLDIDPWALHVARQVLSHWAALTAPIFTAPGWSERDSIIKNLGITCSSAPSTDCMSSWLMWGLRVNTVNMKPLGFVTTVHIWRSEDNVREKFLSFH